MNVPIGFKSLSFYIAGCLAIIATGLLLAAGVYFKSQHDIKTAQEYYVHDARSDLKITAQNINDRLSQLYHDLRAMALLAEIRNSTNDTAPFQNASEIFSPLYQRMHRHALVAAFYIVSVPTTVTGDDASFSLYDGKKVTEYPTQGKQAADKQSTLPEYEIIQEHIRHLHTHALQQPKNALEIHLLTHAISPKKNDQRTQDTTPESAASAGLVVSAPFYNSAGTLAGLLSVVLSEATLQKSLPPRDYALMNQPNHYVVGSAGAGQQNLSLPWINQYQADPSLIFSAVEPIQTIDSAEPSWWLWAGHADADFLAIPAMQAISQFQQWGYAAAFLFSAIAYGIWHRRFRKQRHHLMNELQLAEGREKQAYEIATQFEESVRDILRNNIRFAQSIQNYTGELSRLSESVRKRLARLPQSAATSSDPRLSSAPANPHLLGAKDASSQTSNTKSGKKTNTPLISQSRSEKSALVTQIFGAVIGVANRIHDEVDSHLMQIEDATTQSAHSVQEIIANVELLLDRAFLIASALEQQSAATQDIVENLKHHSLNIQELSRDVLNMRAEVQHISGTVQEALGASHHAQEQYSLANRTNSDVVAQALELQKNMQQSLEMAQQILGNVHVVAGSEPSALTSAQQASIMTPQTNIHQALMHQDRGQESAIKSDGASPLPASQFTDYQKNYAILQDKSCLPQ